MMHGTRRTFRLSSLQTLVVDSRYCIVSQAAPLCQVVSGTSSYSTAASHPCLYELILETQLHANAISELNCAIMSHCSLVKSTIRGSDHDQQWRWDLASKGRYSNIRNRNLPSLT